jgi:hypothetical protein
VGGIDDEDLVVVADDPDVVLDVEVLAVERKTPAVMTCSIIGC